MKNILVLVSAIFFLSLQFVIAGAIKGKIKTKDEALKNVVVYLESIEKAAYQPPKEAAVMDQINLNFVPHVLPVLIGTKVIFPNSDKIRHSVFSVSKVKKFDFGTYTPGVEKSIICDQAGVIPILCYIHHDMSAYIVVLNTPYFVLTNDAGEFYLDEVPAGKYHLKFWNEEIEIKSEEIVIPVKGTLTKNLNVVD